jgi:hypothetical protein
MRETLKKFISFGMFGFKRACLRAFLATHC